MSVRIEFTQQELIQCKEVSQYRDNINRIHDRGKQSIVGSLCDGVIGALGELAISKYFNLEWRGACLTEQVWQLWREHNRDVGPIEVRSTRFGRRDPYVAIKQRDPDDAPLVVAEVSTNPIAVFVKGKTNHPSFAILKGWILIGDAKKLGRWDCRKGKYIIPLGLLKPIDTLDIAQFKFREKSIEELLATLKHS